MRIIDILDSKGCDRTVVEAIAARIATMAAEGIDVAAVRRKDEAAQLLRAGGLSGVATSSFGFLSRLALPSAIRRLAGRHSRVIIHTYSLPLAEQAVMTARSMGADKEVKVVAELREGEARGLLTASERYAAEGIDLFIFPTVTDRDLFDSAAALPVDKTKAVVAPGVRISDPGDKEAGRPFTLLWSGKITAGSCLEDVAEAMSKLGDIDMKLIVAGQGEARETVPLLRRVKALGQEKRIEFLGDVAFSPALASRADAIILPSPTAASNTDVAAAAMAAGLPLVIADSPRNHHIAQNDVNALFFAPSDSLSLATAIRKMGEDEARRESMGRAAHAKAAAQHDIAFHTSAIIQLYTSLFSR